MHYSKTNDNKGPVALFSNYLWAFTSSKAAKKYFSENSITLITTDTGYIAKDHDFKMNVVQMQSPRPGSLSLWWKQLGKFRNMHFNTALIDYSFSVNTILFLMMLRFKQMFIIDLDSAGKIKSINKWSFVRIVLGKAPYFINKSLGALSAKLRMKRSLGMPSELSIETTSACNLKCKGCPTGLGQLKRPTMMISDELFSGIIERNKRNFRYFDLIFPFLYGEPLINKDIFTHLGKLKSAAYPYTRIELHTNGNIKNPKDVAGKLLESGVDLISVSLDGTDSASYESFRKGGNFDLVCEFVKSLTEEKRKLALLKPEILVQMIVTKYSEDKIERFKKLKDELGADRYLLKDFFYEFTHLSEAEAYELAPSKEKLASGENKKAEIIKKKNNLCGWPYRSFVVMCNGNVAPCCIDSNGELIKDLNICDSKISKAWNSAKFTEFRKNMLRGEIEMCKKCFFS